MLSIRNRPTPTATVIISTVVLMVGTLAASTCRSGSATVMAMPSSRLTARISFRFLLLVSLAPMWVPICVMDTSEPMVNRPMPTISSTAPIRKDSIRSVVMGIKDRHITATISVMGRTEAAASLNFSSSRAREVKWHTPFLQGSGVCHRAGEISRAEPHKHMALPS